eukprot:CAMPEP_0171983128 /NCGR_PEP_ID=MMETSP0993-20121228/273120_1 /TAXON_ID=483369 /ORGANISM="non described non described, Strain CCMP2098" /LENGTH=58 /DNA_ID=CAMNT_0012635855 /DNA_START=354 /DNA_END=530 /DNA_ORIENTATION=-
MDDSLDGSTGVRSQVHRGKWLWSGCCRGSASRAAMLAVVCSWRTLCGLSMVASVWVVA